MITIFYKTIKERSPQKIYEFKTGSWVVATEPTDTEITELSEMLKLDEDLLKDARDPYEVPRIEKEEKITYIFTRVPFETESKEVTTFPVMIAIGENFVFTLFQKQTDLLERVLSGRTKYATTQKTKLLFILISAINNSYTRFINGINKGVRKATIDFNIISNKDIVSFVKFESTLNDFMSALVPTNVLLNQLLSGKYVTLYDLDKDLIEDNVLSNSQLIETCRSNLKNIVNIRDAYSTILTNNLNRVIRLLTGITIILTVPTIISSLFGMNVPLPFAENHSAFWIVIGIIILFSAAMFYIFKRNKWF